MLDKVKGFAKIFIVYSIIILSILSIFIFAHDKNKREQLKRDIILSSKYELNIVSTILTNNLSNVLSDLKYLSSTFKATKIDYNTKKNWANLIRAKKHYDQLRYLDINGKEVLRINRDKENVYLVDKEDLQDKNNRYYFKDSIKLEPGEYYISKFDLNIENGKIEFPEKPTIRMAYRTENGVIIINYIATKILEEISLLNLGRDFDLYILNGNSNYILHPDKDKMFDFMYGETNTFNDDHNNILNEIENEYIFKNNEFFNSLSLNDILFEEKVYNKENLKIVYHKKGNLTDTNLRTYDLLALILHILYHYLTIYIIAILSIILITSIRFKSFEVKRKKSEESKKDGLTDTYNRKSGLEIVDHLIEKSKYKESPLFFVFIDIDGLKIVNDTLGHDYGDLLIKKTTEIIHHVIRDNDILFRYGGDEFIIVFRDITFDITESIMKRINKEIDYYNSYESDKFKISMSYGISDTNEVGYSREILINTSDERMYQKKLQKRKARI